MTTIKSQLSLIKSQLPDGVRLIAVSKTKPVEDVQQAYDAGQRLFGENKALEMRDKHEVLPDDIQWHFIGHLQTNKIKYIIPFVSLIHSIDSHQLLAAVNHEAEKHHRVVDCLLQFHIATEESKFGLTLEEAQEILSGKDYPSYANVRIVGVMGMATNTEDQEQVRSEFRHLHDIYEALRKQFFADKPCFKECSMGMSGDYRIATEEGATLVRVGSAIFGARNYAKVND